MLKLNVAIFILNRRILLFLIIINTIDNINGTPLLLLTSSHVNGDVETEESGKVEIVQNFLESLTNSNREKKTLENKFDPCDELLKFEKYFWTVCYGEQIESPNSPPLCSQAIKTQLEIMLENCWKTEIKMANLTTIFQEGTDINLFRNTTTVSLFRKDDDNSEEKECSTEECEQNKKRCCSDYDCIREIDDDRKRGGWKGECRLKGTVDSKICSKGDCTYEIPCCKNYLCSDINKFGQGSCRRRLPSWIPTPPPQPQPPSLPTIPDIISGGGGGGGTPGGDQNQGNNNQNDEVPSMTSSTASTSTTRKPRPKPRPTSTSPTTRRPPARPGTSRPSSTRRPARPPKVTTSRPPKKKPTRSTTTSEAPIIQPDDDAVNSGEDYYYIDQEDSPPLEITEVELLPEYSA